MFETAPPPPGLHLVYPRALMPERLSRLALGAVYASRHLRCMNRAHMYYTAHGILYARLDTEMLDARHAAVPFAVFADFGEC